LEGESDGDRWKGDPVLYDVPFFLLLLLNSGVKVADFGLAKALEQTVGSNSGAGTLAYTAPECFRRQLAQGKPVSSLRRRKPDLTPIFTGNSPAAGPTRSPCKQPERHAGKLAIMQANLAAVCLFSASRVGKELTVVIDPRTMQPVTSPSECHLIPKRITINGKIDGKAVSNKTVRLDGAFDSRIGEKCDHFMRAAIDLLISRNLHGTVAFEGGSQTMGGALVTESGQDSFAVSERILKSQLKLGNLEPFCRQALGMNDVGLVKVTGFVTEPVDLLMARMSMVNSAILVLHYLKQWDVFGPELDRARVLLKKASEGRIDLSDLREVEEMTPGFVLIILPTEQSKQLPPYSPMHLRRLYDANLDVPDGVLDDFPQNCVRDAGDSLQVWLPYGKGLRGVVRFPQLSRTKP
jgi:hypothetical protein